MYVSDPFVAQYTDVHQVEIVEHRNHNVHGFAIPYKNMRSLIHPTWVDGQVSLKPNSWITNYEMESMQKLCITLLVKKVLIAATWWKFCIKNRKKIYSEHNLTRIQMCWILYPDWLFLIISKHM